MTDNTNTRLRALPNVNGRTRIERRGTQIKAVYISHDAKRNIVRLFGEDELDQAVAWLEEMAHDAPA